MIHSFDTEVAKMVGVQAAVLFNNIFFWTEKNRANDENIHEGRAWTYNSKRAFSELFPYMTARQISYALAKLKDAGMVETGNYNKDPRDQTLWYAVTDLGYSIAQNRPVHETKSSNEGTEIVQPLPDSKPDTKTADRKPDRKPDRKENKKKDADASADIEQEFENLWKLYPKRQGKANARKAYFKARKGNPDLFEVVKQGIEDYIAYLKKKGVKKDYIKMGSTWFFQNCWEDEYEGVSTDGSVTGDHGETKPQYGIVL